MSIGTNWSSFFDKQSSMKSTGTKFLGPVAPPEVFFRDWMGQPLFPEQLKAIEAMFTSDFQDMSTDCNELLLQWGEGSGKDFLCERILIYMAYWLVNLHSPHKYLNRAEGTPIDLVNTSVNEEHASSVFFKEFCDSIRLVMNPQTGHNWFEEQGMDLREGRDILTSHVKFPKNITAYSCNSVKYTAEGKCVLIGILDEIAEFKYDKAKKLYDNLKATATSRFPKHHKVVLISYLRDEFDFMLSHWREAENMPPSLRSKYYMSNKKTWEVNLKVTKEDYSDAYEKDPEDSARRYENKIPSKKNQKFLKEGVKITNAVRDFDGSPIISEHPQWTDDLGAEVYQAWFRPYRTKEIAMLELDYMKAPTEDLMSRIDLLKEAHNSANYFIHVDLSKGAVDYAGFCLMHAYQKSEDQLGYYVDLAVQLRPKGNEIDFEEIRKFIVTLQDKGYSIGLVSLDGWNSVDFMQMLEKQGIPCKLTSVDRSMQPYNTLKDVLYKEILDYYYNPILLRELNELQVLNGKVDHPKESQERAKEEGKRAGSKDLADALAGAVFNAVSSTNSMGGSVSTAPMEDPVDIIDMMFK